MILVHGAQPSMCGVTEFCRCIIINLVSLHKNIRSKITTKFSRDTRASPAGQSNTDVGTFLIFIYLSRTIFCESRCKPLKQTPKNGKNTEKSIRKIFWSAHSRKIKIKFKFLWGSFYDYFIATYIEESWLVLWMSSHNEIFWHFPSCPVTPFFSKITVTTFLKGCLPENQLNNNFQF